MQKCTMHHSCLHLPLHPSPLSTGLNDDDEEEEEPL